MPRRGCLKAIPNIFAIRLFPTKDLAIEAYAHVPSKFRVPFEETVEHINHLIGHSLTHLEETIAVGDEGILRMKASSCSRAVQKLMDVASVIIHGSSIAMQQSEIDEMLA